MKYKLYKKFKLRRSNQQKGKTKRTKRYWTRPHLADKARHRFGDYYQLIPPSKTNDPEQFYKMKRMSVEAFDELTELVKSRIERQYVVREPISVEERLALTIK